MGQLLTKLMGKDSHKAEQQRPQQQQHGQVIDTDDHLVPIEQFLASCGTSVERGLSENEARRLLLQHGPNRLTPPKETSELVKFLRQLFSGFSLLLWAGAILCIGAYVVEKGKNPDNVRVLLNWLNETIVNFFALSTALPGRGADRRGDPHGPLLLPARVEIFKDYGIVSQDDTTECCGHTRW